MSKAGCPYGTEPMFQVGATGAARRQSSPRSVAQGHCPKCSISNLGKVGIVAQGEHRAWREHYVTTWGGTKRQCIASGVTLCACPPKDVPGEETPACTCQGKG